MLSAEFLNQLHKMNRVEKLKVMQILVNDLALEEETAVFANTQYEVWSPYDSAGAAETLLQMLEEHKASNNAR